MSTHTVVPVRRTSTLLVVTRFLALLHAVGAAGGLVYSFVLFAAYVDPASEADPLDGLFLLSGGSLLVTGLVALALAVGALAARHDAVAFGLALTCSLFVLLGLQGLGFALFFVGQLSWLAVVPVALAGCAIVGLVRVARP